MIRRTQLIEAGRFNKPHGIKGEISATLDIDADLGAVKCLVMEIDGLFVPFFISGFRPKTAETSLVTIDGIGSDTEAREFVNKPFYLLRDDPALAEDEDAEDDDDTDDEGFYASDLIGFEAMDVDAGVLGRITDVNDSTVNMLFVITTPEGKEILVPVAEEFIEEIDASTETITLNLPPEIITLNQ